jgi:hypothetical protein
MSKLELRGQLAHAQCFAPLGARVPLGEQELSAVGSLELGPVATTFFNLNWHDFFAY